MKKLIAASLATVMAGVALVAAPAQAEPAKGTELVDLDGRNVERLQLRHGFNAAWVVDTQKILWRDDTRDHYLVTLTQACEQLAVRRPFGFHPESPWQLLSGRDYEIRPFAGSHCEVAKIERVDDAKATSLRASALRRAW